MVANEELNSQKHFIYGCIFPSIAMSAVKMVSTPQFFVLFSPENWE